MNIYYTGEDEKDYAIIPLQIQSYAVEPTYAENNIINDISQYKSSITDKEQKDKLNNKIGDLDLEKPSIKVGENSITTEETGEKISLPLIEKDINLYYIENFTYTLDSDEYTNIDTNETVKRKDNYMFKINLSLDPNDKLNIIK